MSNECHTWGVVSVVSDVSRSLPDTLQDTRLQSGSEFTDDRMRVRPQKRKHTGRCRCECHSGVGEALRCDHCYAYYTNDWSNVITDWGKPVSRGVEFRIRG